MSQMGSFGSGGSIPTTIVRTLTGNSGGAVGPTGNNINIVGSGGVSVVGNPGTSTLTITATLAGITYTNVNTSPYVVQSTDQYLSVDSSGGAITVQFPDAATSAKYYIVKDRTGSSAVNNITITTVSAGVNIDAATSFVMNTAYESANLMGNGVSYEVW